MRLLRFVLWLVLVGAVVIWVDGLAHGFKGTYCFNSSGTCTSSDIQFPGHVVVWLAPVVAIVALWLLLQIKRYMIARYTRQVAALPLPASECR